MITNKIGFTEVYMRTFTKDKLDVKIYDSRAEMGQAAASDIAACIHKLLESKDELNIIFAAAPSQNDFLASLLKEEIDWTRVNAFHMDEYIGLEDKFEKTFAFVFSSIFF